MRMTRNYLCSYLSAISVQTQATTSVDSFYMQIALSVPSLLPDSWLIATRCRKMRFRVQRADLLYWYLFHVSIWGAGRRVYKLVMWLQREALQIICCLGCKYFTKVIGSSPRPFLIVWLFQKEQTKRVWVEISCTASARTCSCWHLHWCRTGPDLYHHRSIRDRCARSYCDTSFVLSDVSRRWKLSLHTTEIIKVSTTMRLFLGMDISSLL